MPLSWKKLSKVSCKRGFAGNRAGLILIPTQSIGIISGEGNANKFLGLVGSFRRLAYEFIPHVPTALGDLIDWAGTLALRPLNVPAVNFFTLTISDSSAIPFLVVVNVY